MKIPIVNVEIADGLGVSFPQNLCCNCGSTKQLQTIEQDTRVTRYFFGGGSELTFKFPLPFCPNCENSAKKRPGGFVKKVLVFLLISVIFSFVLTIGGMALDMRWLVAHFYTISIPLAIAFIFFFYLRRRPKGDQTSFYQPVRINKLKQEFVSGMITAIHLTFTNVSFAKEFFKQNKKIINKKFVEIKTI